VSCIDNKCISGEISVVPINSSPVMFGIFFDQKMLLLLFGFVYTCWSLQGLHFKFFQSFNPSLDQLFYTAEYSLNDRCDFFTF